MSLEAELSKLEKLADEKLKQLSEHAVLEQQLSKDMSLRFKDNIQAFKTYLPNIAKEFQSYIPQSLEIFCSPSGVANIVDQATGQPLYSDDPIQQCKEQVEKQINNPKYTSLAFSQNEDVKVEFLHTRYMEKIYNLYLDAKKDLEPLDHIPEYLGSMIMFGVGLGYHLEFLLDKISVEHLYISEPNSDLFFASLYTCDWVKVLKAVDENGGYLVLNIGVSYKQFTTDFLNEMKNRGSFTSVNSVTYQHYPSKQLTEIIEQFSQDFHLISVGWGFYDDGLIAVSHDYQNLKLNIPFLKKNASLPAKWKDAPIYVVANGPSVDGAFEVIKENRDQVIVASCGSAINSLLNAGIIPDFHVALERTNLTYDYLVEFVDQDILKKINFLTVNIMYPGCAGLFKWAGMAFKPAEPATAIYVDYIDKHRTFESIHFCNPQVANTGLSFAISMGFTDIYLFGVDCGYKDPKYHHSKNSIYYSADGTEKEKLGNVVRIGEIKVEGNFGGEVYSTSFMDTARFYLQSLIVNHTPRVSVYNCSDGAKIDGAYPLRPDMVLNMSPLETQQEKDALVEYIKQEFFQVRPFDNEQYLKYIDVDGFSNTISEMIACIDKRFNSRQEAVKALTEQARGIYSLSRTYHRHIYFLLEGSMVYMQSVLRMILYGFKDEQKTLDLLKEATDLCVEFLSEANKKYPTIFEDNHNVDAYLMHLFRDQSK